MATDPNTTHDFILDGECKSIPNRGISVAACQRYGYQTATFDGKPCHVANFYDDKGVVVGQKLRLPGRKFTTIGDVPSTVLYGKTRLRDDGKMVVVTEGELDCLAVSDVLGNKWPVVSVPHGVQSAPKAIKANLEWLESFEKVVLCFDADEAGAKATAECRVLLSPGKVHVAALTHKDPCEYLKAGKRGELVRAIWDAPKWTPSGVVTGSKILEAALDFSDYTIPCGWPWECLTKMGHGLRSKELIVLAAGTGTGKSSFCRNIAAHLLTHGQTVGYLALEEEIRLTSRGIYSLHAGTNLVLYPDSDAIKAAHEAWGDRLFLYEHFGSTQVDDLLSKVRYMVLGLGCRVIILDHLSIVVSGLEIDDERKAIDVMMTRLRSIVEETKCLLFAVTHLKRQSQGKGHESGTQVTLSDFRGSQSIAQLADTAIALERDQQADSEESRNMVTIRYLKSRAVGKTGIAGTLTYSHETGTLTECQEFFPDTPSND